VKDHGIGISQEDQVNLFQRFFRGANVTNIQGTGLGLSIIARYIELMNGTIDVESIVNEGTTFNIALPNNLENE
jgi:signal transduction histidine kinase